MPGLQVKEKLNMAAVCCGALGAAVALWTGYEAVSAAMTTGQVPVSTLNSGARDVVHAHWQLAAPLAITLLFLFAACIALAVPRLKALTFGAPPLVAIFGAGLMFLGMGIFCSSQAGNVMFVAIAAVLVALLRGAGRLETRVSRKEA